MSAFCEERRSFQLEVGAASCATYLCIFDRIEGSSGATWWRFQIEFWVLIIVHHGKPIWRGITANKTTGIINAKTFKFPSRVFLLPPSLQNKSARGLKHPHRRGNALLTLSLFSNARWSIKWSLNFYHLPPLLLFVSRKRDDKLRRSKGLPFHDMEINWMRQWAEARAFVSW